MIKNKLFYCVQILLLSISANCFWFIKNTGKLYCIPIFVVTFLFTNFFTLFSKRAFQTFRLRVCLHGVVRLKIFLYSVLVSAIYHVVAAFYLLPHQWGILLWSIAICICAHAIVFWNGMISVYSTSIQLGIRSRVIGVICGFIPIVNLIMLVQIIEIVSTEIQFETEKEILNSKRKEEQICHTKYPVLLVHGVFFRDSKYMNYWGRIPAELIKNGAKVFYGNHQSASSVKDSAKELAERIEEIVAQTGCEKVNIIAHSKGGLDCCYAVSLCNVAPYVASITTINTPHLGCAFADYLLNKIPMDVQQKVEKVYNSTLKRFGDSNPDFISAVCDLTTSNCIELNKVMSTVDKTKGIYCRSVGSKLNRATSSKFPLNFTYLLAKYFDGANDGLVSEKSFLWGDHYIYLTVKGNRGISHGDMIDLNRENIQDFDVREFYVELVSELKQMGL